MGLGSILGTGIFVSIGIAAGITGPSVVYAVLLAALVATFNGLSSAQLAANHAVSGGTYEYGYRYLSPTLGFSAGWMFLCAKSASAATASLGFAGYLLSFSQISFAGDRVIIALAIISFFTLIVVGGLKRSNQANIVIVSVTLIALITLVVSGAPHALDGFSQQLQLWQPSANNDGVAKSFMRATALMFVAYTGYGRIATLGEEIKNPRRNIPRAMITTLSIIGILYALVSWVAVGVLGADNLGNAAKSSAAPLQKIGEALGAEWLSTLIVIGAITAMLGVLLNLLLGLSRVALAMARRNDLPAKLARVNENNGSPTRAVLFVGIIIAGLSCLGSVETTWSFSAFTVLIYYSLTNAAALQLSAEERLFPRWISYAGLLSCLGLAFWVQPLFWLSGTAVLLVGVVGRALIRKFAV
ncbi:MAG: APC family permease [Myxococcota bacterium]|nr:APC family permease [Myxococcota bacterium]